MNLDVLDENRPLLKQVEEILIKFVLDKNEGTKEEAAATLGISIRTLRNKINASPLLREYKQIPKEYDQEAIVAEFKKGISLKKIAEKFETQEERIRTLLKERFKGEYKHRMQVYRYCKTRDIEIPEKYQ